MLAFCRTNHQFIGGTHGFLSCSVDYVTVVLMLLIPSVVDGSPSSWLLRQGPNSLPEAAVCPEGFCFLLVANGIWKPGSGCTEHPYFPLATPVLSPQAQDRCSASLLCWGPVLGLGPPTIYW